MRGMGIEPSSPEKQDETPPQVSRTLESLPHEPSLLRFGLRQLFWFVGVVCVLLTCMASGDLRVATALLMAALVVVLHVASTFIGDRLRAQADGRVARETGQEFTEHVHRRAGEASDGTRPRIEVAPSSPWHHRGVTPLPWQRRIIIAGVLIGGIGGAVFLALTVGHRTSAGGIAVGAMSLAVLGGWFGFLGSSFYGIFRHGLREALAEQKKDEARRTPGR